MAHPRYYLPIIKMKDYNVMIDGKHFFDQTIKDDIKALKKLRRVIEIVKQLVVCQITIISKNIIK